MKSRETIYKQLEYKEFKTSKKKEDYLAQPIKYSTISAKTVNSVFTSDAKLKYFAESLEPRDFKTFCGMLKCISLLPEVACFLSSIFF